MRLTHSTSMDVEFVHIYEFVPLSEFLSLNNETR
jgi:hypothetical protein